MRPIIFLALLVIWLIWVDQDRLSVVVTPRYLYEDTFAICWLWRVRLGAATELLLNLDNIIYRRSGNFRCYNIFVNVRAYENLTHEYFLTTNY